VFLFRKKHVNSENLNDAINKGLRVLKNKIGIVTDGGKFTSYSARRSWATIGNNVAKIDKYTIHEALNHTDKTMAVTDLYIDKDFSHIWEANRKVLELFDWTNITDNLATHIVLPWKKTKESKKNTKN
jgi:integrase